MTDTNGRLRAHRLKLRNILGIQELDVELGQITRVEGGNRVGKTSVLEGVRALLGGGHDASLIRQGADEAEVVLVLDDETEITKRITPAGSDLKVRHPDHGQVSAPQTWLNGILDQALGLNPVEFLTSKNRAELLLEAMPLEISAEKLKEAVGELLKDPRPLEGEHALETIDRIHTALYDERTGVNRIAREKRKAAKELKASLPETIHDPAELRERKAQLEREQKQGETKLTREIAEVETALAKATAALEQERDRKIAEIKEEYARRIDAEEEKASTHKENLQLEGRPRLNRMGEEIAAIEARLESATGHEHTRRMLEEAEATAAENEEKSQELTAAMAQVDSLKEGILRELPLEGVTIRNGEVYKDEIPFSRLNHEQQVRLAVEIAKMRAGKLPLIPVDGLEALEEQHYQAFVEELRRSDLQAVVTRVTEGPLAVSTEG